MNFKVGDRVRVKSASYIKKCPYGYTPEMLECAGKEMKIRAINCGAYIKLQGIGDYSWSEAELEPIEDWVEIEKDEFKINDLTLTRRGRDVSGHVTCNDGKFYVATARCSPEDEFDFAKGAKIATDRVLARVEEAREKMREEKRIATMKATKFTVEKFRREEIVVNCKTEHDAEMFLMFLHGCGLTWAGWDLWGSVKGSLVTDGTCFHNYKERTCYMADVNGVTYAPIEYIKREYEDLPIIEFSKAMLQDAI